MKNQRRNRLEQSFVHTIMGSHWTNGGISREREKERERLRGKDKNERGRKERHIGRERKR